MLALRANTSEIAVNLSAKESASARCCGSALRTSTTLHVEGLTEIVSLTEVTSQRGFDRITLHEQSRSSLRVLSPLPWVNREKEAAEVGPCPNWSLEPAVRSSILDLTWSRTCGIIVAMHSFVSSRQEMEPENETAIFDEISPSRKSTPHASSLIISSSTDISSYT